jgi:hypothetical protein
MKYTIFVLLGIFSVFSVPCARGATTIDLQIRSYTVATLADMGQSFTVPTGSDTRLDSFQFYGSAAGGDVTFNALIYQFNPATQLTIGSPLYDSGPRIALDNFTLQTFAFSTGGINLAPGGIYLIDLYQNYRGNVGNLDLYDSITPYSAGHFFVHGWPDQWYTDSHIQNLAFQAVFNAVPEPSSLALIGAAALGLITFASRRQVSAHKRR